MVNQTGSALCINSNGGLANVPVYLYLLSPDQEKEILIKGFNTVPERKWPFLPIFGLGENFNPRNIQYTPVVKIFACLDLNKKFTFSVGR